MRENKLTNKQIGQIVERIIDTYCGDLGINFIDASDLPVRSRIGHILDLLTELLFPGYTGRRTVTKANVNFIIGDIISQVYSELSGQIERAFRYRCRMEDCEPCDCEKLSHEATIHLLGKIPDIRRQLKGDVQAAYDGDPAAKSYEEIIISYPCIIAIATHRIAHQLYLKQVPLIGRLMSEIAHSKTGIDIHPGADIGENFFIDHGTGVVVGETTVIGDNVKLYQGTTLGAVSFAKDVSGKIKKDGKRHPTIEDNVTIYAEATILGNVIIGKNSVIGGNVWINESVPPDVTVTTPKADLLYRKRKTAKQQK